MTPEHYLAKYKAWNWESNKPNLVIEPRPAVEAVRTKTGFIYNAEVMVLDGNFVLAKNLSTHEEAKQIAQAFVDGLLLKQFELLQNHTANLTKAKE